VIVTFQEVDKNYAMMLRRQARGKEKEMKDKLVRKSSRNSFKLMLRNICCTYHKPQHLQKSLPKPDISGSVILWCRTVSDVIMDIVVFTWVNYHTKGKLSHPQVKLMNSVASVIK
jgi:hypothetical protein